MSNSPASSNRLHFKEKLGYGLGDTASNFFFHTFNIILLGYYTDVFGLSAGAVGTMFLFTKLFDAFTDPAMGLISDRTRTKFGKFRPYILWMAFPFGLIGYSMFANPDLSPTGKLIYAYVTYSLMMLVYTAINVPYSALLGVISPSSDERTTVSTYRFVCAFGAQLLISAFVLPLTDLMGGGDRGVGYQHTMALFAVISVALWLFTFSSTKERVEPPADQKIDLKGDFGVVIRNKPWIFLVIAAIFTLANVGVRGGATYFYILYYVVDSDLPVWWIFDRTSVAWLSGSLGMVVGTFLTKPLTHFFDKRTLMIALTALNGLFMMGIFLIPADQYWTLIIVGFIGTVIVGPTPALVWAMYGDCADYGEWKFGRRTTGLIFSGALFAQKMGLAFGAGLSGWILGWFGYVANQPQTDTAILGIRLIFTIFPGVLTLLAAAAIFFYPLTDTRVREIDAELEDRRHGASGG